VGLGTVIQGPPSQHRHFPQDTRGRSMTHRSDCFRNLRISRMTPHATSPYPVSFTHVADPARSTNSSPATMQAPAMGIVESRTLTVWRVYRLLVGIHHCLTAALNAARAFLLPPQFVFDQVKDCERRKYHDGHVNQKALQRANQVHCRRDLKI